MDFLSGKLTLVLVHIYWLATVVCNSTHIKSDSLKLLRSLQMGTIDFKWLDETKFI